MLLIMRTLYVQPHLCLGAQTHRHSCPVDARKATQTDMAQTKLPVSLPRPPPMLPMAVSGTQLLGPRALESHPWPIRLEGWLVQPSQYLTDLLSP